MHKLLLATACVIGLIGQAQAGSGGYNGDGTTHCKAVVLRDIPGEDTGMIGVSGPYAGKPIIGDPILRGYIFDWITQLRVDPKTQLGQFCEKGGSCYPADLIRLLNCTISQRPMSPGWFSVRGN